MYHGSRWQASRNVDFKLEIFESSGFRTDRTYSLGVVGLASIGEPQDFRGLIVMAGSIARKMTFGNETPSVAHQLKQGLEEDKLNLDSQHWNPH
jgi:hypothetical protein